MSHKIEVGDTAILSNRNVDNEGIILSHSDGKARWSGEVAA